MYFGAWSSSTGDADWGLRPLFSTASPSRRTFSTSATTTTARWTRRSRRGWPRADPAKRAAAYAEAQKLIWNDAPWVFLSVDQLIAGESKTSAGVVPHAGRRHVDRRGGSELIVSARLGSAPKVAAMLAFILRRLAGHRSGPARGVGVRVRLRPAAAGRSGAAGGRTRCDRRGCAGGPGRDRPRPAALAAICALCRRRRCGAISAARRTRASPSSSEIGERFMPTLWLTLVAMGWSTLAGLAIGVLSGVRRGRWQDQAAHGARGLRHFLPERSGSGLLLIDLFSVRLGWLPTGGYDGLAQLRAAVDHARRRASRRCWRASPARPSSRSPSEDYVRTARAKGVPERRVIWRHALRNALIPVDHHDRAAVRFPARRLDRGRDGVRLAWARPAAGRFGRRFATIP